MSEKKGETLARKFHEKLEEEARRDAEAAKQFPELTKSILQGTSKTEDATVVLKDGSKRRLTIRALGEGEIIDALNQAEMDLTDLGAVKDFSRHTKFQQIICSKAIVSDQFTPEEIGKAFQFGASGKLSVRILHLSGFFGTEGMEFFREESSAVS